jgi:RNA polymerase sigma-70 factor (ECF subfamily)
LERRFSKSFRLGDGCGPRQHRLRASIPENSVCDRITFIEPPASITGLLTQWGQGDQAALAELTAQVHRELHAIAKSYLRRRRLNQTLQPTALINEAWLRLLGQTQAPRWENRAHFFGIAARLMRIVLVDDARSRGAAKRGGAAEVVTLDENMVLCPNRAPDVLEVSEALDQLAKVDERKAKVIELRYFGGMDREEIATALDLTVATVKRDLRLGEAWLRRFLLS